MEHESKPVLKTHIKSRSADLRTAPIIIEPPKKSEGFKALFGSDEKKTKTSPPGNFPLKSNSEDILTEVNLPRSPRSASPPVSGIKGFASLFRPGSPDFEFGKLKLGKKDAQQKKEKEREKQQKKEEKEKKDKRKKEEFFKLGIKKTPKSSSVGTGVSTKLKSASDDWIEVKPMDIETLRTLKGGKQFLEIPNTNSKQLAHVSRSFEEPSAMDNYLRHRSSSSPDQVHPHEAEEILSHPHHPKHNKGEDTYDLETVHSKFFKISGFRDEERYASTIDDVYMVDQSTTWLNVKIPTNRVECSMQLKYLIRKGIPDFLRGGIWRTIAGFHEYMQKNPDAYGDARKSVFGDKVPKYILRVPTFGGSFRPQDHYLNEHGTEAAKRILCVLAMENPGIEYLPVLPDLVCLLLHFMQESDAYVVATLMLNERNPNRYYFRPTKKGITLFLYTFDDLLNKHAPKIYAHMKGHNISSHHFADEWFLRLFVSVFPFSTVLRIFDAFINEGSKILYRVALGLMKLHKDEILACNTSNGFLDVLQNASANCKDPEELMKKAFSMRMKWKVVEQFNKKNAPRLAHVVEPTYPVYYRPKITTPSNIIADEQFELLWSWLPHKFCIKDPVLVFSSKTEGFSLRHFLTCVANEYPTILIVKTTNNEVFGAFVTDCWVANHRGYYGGRESFLWRFTPKPQKFGWEEANPDYIMLVTNKQIQIGGGNGQGLWIDEDLLKGRTEKCDTFLNEPLTNDGRAEFECTAIEVFGFK